MLEDAIQRAPQIVRASGSPKKIHTLHGLINGRVFDGQIEAPEKTYKFSYAPATAALVDHHLVLRGRFSLTAPPRQTRSIDNVEAKLVATQGGVGAPLNRRPANTNAAPEPKPEQNQGPETELQPGLHAFASPKYDELGRPIVDATGPLAFVGVLYFVLSPLDSRALEVPLDLRRVQLGGRLAPTEDLGRELQLSFSDLVAALHGERPDEQTANKIVAELNRTFSQPNVKSVVGLNFGNEHQDQS